MIIKVSADEFPDAMGEILNDLNGKVVKATTEANRETAEKAVKILKEGGPFRNRTGKYRRSWTNTENKTNRASVITGIWGQTVYAKKPHWRLTHLLEKGFQHRRGGRVRAFPHIEPVNDKVPEWIEAKVKEKLEG
ncbi:MAG: hypothetical protein FWG91_13770 [Lachnospiraceae bacterium]|nr:hypothetical protein [Lachnospiraceae bacterium]